MIVENAFANELNIPNNWQALVIMAIIIVAMVIYKKWKKKALSPILLITVAAISGIIIYGI